MAHTVESMSQHMTTALEAYRDRIRTLMLDSTVSVYDRLHSLYVAPFILARRGHTHVSNATIDRLRMAEQGPVMFRATRTRDSLSSLVVGYLNPEAPWAITVAERVGQPKGELALQANFADLRRIGHEIRTARPDGSFEYEPGPNVERVAQLTQIVSLGGDYPGDENVAHRFKMVPDRIVTGWDGIHDYVDREYAELAGVRRHLHIAASVAAAAMGPMSTPEE